MSNEISTVLQTDGSVTAVQVATQFGLTAKHGAYAWRVILNSPLEVQRCQDLVKKLVRPARFIHHRKPQTQDDMKPFIVNSDEQEVVNEGPSDVIRELFEEFGAELVAACTSQVQEMYYIAWARPGWPLLALLKETTALPAFDKFVNDDINKARKLYNAFMRGVMHVLRDGSWVDAIGATELSLEARYTATGRQMEVDREVIDILLLAVPTLLNTVKALSAASGIPPLHPMAVSAARTQLLLSINKLVTLSNSEGARGVVWDDNNEATELGNRVAHVHKDILQILETLSL
ncbi:hypothetical protein BKA62DRAFT_708118 [Auriculariales sp. MPI-PUGE-AT-0066]|nr:hypothetical protein BKA62DRAFT_708118 [Auriculariales sp. MPI-PUGE-AT-0066]